MYVYTHVRVCQEPRVTSLGRVVLSKFAKWSPVLRKVEFPVLRYGSRPVVNGRACARV